MTIEGPSLRWPRTTSSAVRRSLGAGYRRYLHPALRATIRRSRRSRRRGQETVVSIVVTVDGATAATRTTLDSVIRQTYENLDIVVVGPAAAAGVVGRYRRWDARIQFLRTGDGVTVSGRRNLGAALAGGAQLGFVDAGEILAPKAVAALTRSLIATSSDFAAGRRLLDPGGDDKPAPEWADRCPVIAPRIGATVGEAPDVLADHGVSGKLFVRSFFDDAVAPFPDDRLLSDSLPITRAYVSGRFDILPARVCTRPQSMRIGPIPPGSAAAAALERAVFVGTDAETYLHWFERRITQADPAATLPG